MLPVSVAKKQQHTPANQTTPTASFGEQSRNAAQARVIESGAEWNT
jgi:hypothetical protein